MESEAWQRNLTLEIKSICFCILGARIILIIHQEGAIVENDAIQN